MLALLCIPLMALINRVRGGVLGKVGEKVPGRLQFWLTPFVALTAWLSLPLGHAVVFSAGWLIWSLPGWGQWYDLGRGKLSSGEPSWWEAAVTRICFDNDYLAFTLRDMICLIPLACIWPAALLLAPLQTAGYEIGWRVRPAGGTGIGEYLTGALWGAFLFLLSF